MRTEADLSHRTPNSRALQYELPSSKKNLSYYTKARTSFTLDTTHKGPQIKLFCSELLRQRWKMIPYKSKVPGEASIRTKTYVLKFAIRKIISLLPTYSTAHHDHLQHRTTQIRPEKRKKIKYSRLGMELCAKKDHHEKLFTIWRCLNVEGCSVSLTSGAALGPGTIEQEEEKNVFFWSVAI